MNSEFIELTEVMCFLHSVSSIYHYVLNLVITFEQLEIPVVEIASAMNHDVSRFCRFTVANTTYD